MTPNTKNLNQKTKLGGWRLGVGLGQVSQSLGGVGAPTT